MTPFELRPPPKGFTKAEREWIEKVLIPAIRTVYGTAGRNVSITNNPNAAGQVINASDCAPCP